MKEEELIKKLESVELPRIELQSHQCRLRMALLDAGYLQRQRGVAILELAKSKVKGGIDIMIRGLVSRQPVWKTAVASVLAIALIMGLALTLPGLTGQSPEALAADIAKNSPQVQVALGGEKVTVLEIKVVDDKGTLVCEGAIGQYILVDVDLEAAEVTELEVVSMPELTEAEKEEAIAIAKADPRVQELLEQGASIDRVAPMISFIIEDTEDEKGEFAVVKTAHIGLKLGDRMWFAHINLEDKKVERLIEIEKMDVTKVGEEGEGEVEYFPIEEAPIPKPTIIIEP